MKFFFLIALLFSSPCFGQQYNGYLGVNNGPLSGPCPFNTEVRTDVTTGNTYTCTKGTWTAASVTVGKSAPTYTQTDPRFYGCMGRGDSSTAATACWQSAVNYMETNGGVVRCLSGQQWFLNRVALGGADVILGESGDQGTNGCAIWSAVDAAFVSKNPASFVNSVVIKDIQFENGVNPIDIPQVNQTDFENLEFTNYTGCAIVMVFGERQDMHRITTVHNFNSKGFASLCTGDQSKSLFASQLPAGTFGQALSMVDGLREIGNQPTNYEQYLWWAAGNGVISDTVRNLYCAFSCSNGIAVFGGGLSDWAEYYTTFDNIDLDNIGLQATPAAIGLDFNGQVQGGRVDSYNPSFNTNYLVTQLDILTSSAFTVQDSTFSGNNSTTFGVKFENNAQKTTLLSVSGAATSPVSGVVAVNSALNPSMGITSIP